MTALFPLSPNWSTPYKVTREFRTTVQISRSGKEQRRALRATARKRIEFAVLAAGDAGVASFNRWMTANIGYANTLADQAQSAKVLAPATAGSTTMQVDSHPGWLAGTVVVQQGLQVESRTVSAVTGSASPYTITFATPTAFAWSVTSKVLAVLSGRVDLEGVKTDLQSDAVVTASIAFAVAPGSETWTSPPGASLTFNNREVFLYKPNWSSAPQVTFSRPYGVADYDEGVTNYFNHVAFASRVETATYLAVNATTATAIENVFLRAQGQRGEFYKPTWLTDLVPMSVAPAGTNTITVAGTEVGTTYASDTVYRAIYVQYRDQSYAMYLVASVGLTGPNSVVTLGSNLTTTIDPATVQFISWMPVHRFATDTLTTEWVTDSVAQIQLAMVTLEDLTPEVMP